MGLAHGFSVVTWTHHCKPVVRQDVMAWQKSKAANFVVAKNLEK